MTLLEARVRGCLRSRAIAPARPAALRRTRGWRLPARCGTTLGRRDTVAAADANAETGTGRKRIFITGAAGVVGTALRKHLRDRYDYRLQFHSTVPEVDRGDQVVTGSVADFEAMLEATRGMDA